MGETAFDSGLLMAPQGIGAMLTMPIAGFLVDKIGPGRIVMFRRHIHHHRTGGLTVSDHFHPKAWTEHQVPSRLSRAQP